MAPRKRKAAGDEATPAKASTRMTTRASEAASRRQFRSSSKGSTAAKLAVKPPARKKPAKAAARKKKKNEKKKEKEENAEVEQKQAEEDVKSDGGEKAKVEDAAEEAAKASKTVVIERCTQCNSFKTRAEQVRAALENVAGITVTINPVKPRRGCFEIREEGGETFISLLNMKRPFKLMKDLNMEEVIDNIIQKIQ